MILTTSPHGSVLLVCSSQAKCVLVSVFPISNSVSLLPSTQIFFTGVCHARLLLILEALLICNLFRELLISSVYKIPYSCLNSKSLKLFYLFILTCFMPVSPVGCKPLEGGKIYTYLIDFCISNI
jgi:hypothetical protein